MTVELLPPIVEGGIRNNHFFEGRLLTGRDLRDEQLANHLHHWQLGRTIGSGVVEGLWVTKVNDGSGSEAPQLKVTRGLALNRKGQTLELMSDPTISLIRPQVELPDDAGVFFNCKKQLATRIPTGIGIYVLVVSPASEFKERAPKSGLDSNGKVVGCGRRYEQEGVRFRLEELVLSDLACVSDASRDRISNELLGATDLKRASELRNLVAHLCFGTEVLSDSAADPFVGKDGESPLCSYGALAEMSLTDCDVPLALFYWSPTGISFLDHWSVRRRVLATAPSMDWPIVSAHRPVAETEAMLFQFQKHLADLIEDHSNPAGIRAKDYFRYLPPVGFLPIRSSERPRGFRYEKFLEGITHREPVKIISGKRIRSLFTDGARIFSLITTSFMFPAIDLSIKEMIWLYQVRQNHHDLPADTTADKLPYMVFASGYMPFYGNARFNVSRWDYSNYGRI